MLKKYAGRLQAGDTLVEVLLAFAIFSTAAVTITRVMNEGYARMFSSGQQSQVQALLRGQVAIIQAAHDAEIKDPNSTAWDDIVSRMASDDTKRRADVNPSGCAYSANKNRLYFLTTAGGSWTSPQRVLGSSSEQIITAARTVTPKPDGSSLWIEAKYTPADLVHKTRGYYDFYAKACWSDKVLRQLKTVVRLYDLTPVTGEGSTFIPPPSTPPAPPAPLATTIDWDGGNLVQACTVIPGGVCYNHSYPYNGGPYQVAFSCWPFKMDYELPEKLDPGNYKLTITYTNMGIGHYAQDMTYPFACRTASGLPAGYPGFIVSYSVNGTVQKSNVQLLPATGYMGITTTTNIPIANPIDGAGTPRISVNWTNDVAAGTNDANLGIYHLKLEKQ